MVRKQMKILYFISKPKIGKLDSFITQLLARFRGLENDEYWIKFLIKVKVRDVRFPTA
jgi:hypothetical protein